MDKWHASHTVEELPYTETNSKEKAKRCTKCGLNSGSNFEHHNSNEFMELPCRSGVYFHSHSGKDGTELVPYFIPEDEIKPMPPREWLIKLRRFWHPSWCGCNQDFGVGYRLARHEYVGDFCIACDSESITSKHHCHCPVCGGINQVG